MHRKKNKSTTQIRENEIIKESYQMERADKNRETANRDLAPEITGNSN